MMLSIRRQLLGSAILALAGFVLFGVVAFATLNELKINGPRYLRIIQGKDLVADLVPQPVTLIESYLAVHQMLGETDRRRLDELIRDSQDLRTQFEARHQYWEKMLPPGQLKSTLHDKAYPPASEFLRLVDESFIPAVRRGDQEAARQIADGELKPLYEQHMKVVLEVVQLATRQTSEEEDAALTITRQRSALVPLLGLGLAAITLTIGLYLSRRIVRAIEQMRRVAERTAGGDLTSRVPYEGRDELGQLAVSTNQMIDSLRGVLSHISDRAVTLATASEELSSVSTQMIGSAEETSRQASMVSSGSEQISHSVESVSVSVEEMIASIQEISKNTSEAARVATVAAGEADITNAAVNKLGASSGEIGKVVQVINTIAQQTNLLALNATIEAARAGEAGKGFAVVANEVKELANETAAATKDISRKIEAIQADTTDAIQAIGKISETIQQIKDISNSIATALEQQLATSGEIGRNLTEAARGSNEISAGIVKVAEIARDTAGSSENTQKAAEELARLAAELRGLTQRFRYTSDDESGDTAQEERTAKAATAAPATVVAMEAARAASRARAARGEGRRADDAPPLANAG
ncbi:MAG TPA: methyl-accepting chemotaxis protein [Candidatus Eisenbacteria bacterium]|nr:methyl-accepting chemotaxis protein [Candidatus Eisenbacteria bacterium]